MIIPEISAAVASARAIGDIFKGLVNPFYSRSPWVVICQREDRCC